MFLDETHIGKPAVARPNVFSLESLIAWLETMPADGKYDWNDQSACMYTQYLIAHGEDWRGGNYTKLRRAIGDMGEIALELPWTFSAALSRARTAAQHGGT